MIFFFLLNLNIQKFLCYGKNVGRSKKKKKQPRPERCKHDNHDVLDNILKMKKIKKKCQWKIKMTIQQNQ